MKFDNMYQK